MDLNEIINRISLIRNRANLSARALSLQIDKNASYINRLETSRDFEPSLTTLLDIIEVCNSSVEEFFYYSISEYKTDADLIKFLKGLKENKKKAIKELLTEQ